MVVKGLTGQIELDQNGVTIHRKGLIPLLCHGFKGSKTIPYNSIVAVEFRPGGFLINGYLKLTLRGGPGSDGGIISALRDGNTVVFTLFSNAKFEEAKHGIERRMPQLPS